MDAEPYRFFLNLDRYPRSNRHVSELGNVKKTKDFRSFWVPRFERIRDGVVFFTCLSLLFLGGALLHFLMANQRLMVNDS